MGEDTPPRPRPRNVARWAKPSGLLGTLDSYSIQGQTCFHISASIMTYAQILNITAVLLKDLPFSSFLPLPRHVRVY